LVLFLKHHKLRVPPELLASDTTILVIDDDPEVGQSIKKAIKTTHPDWNIQIATDGYAAGEAVATGHPSIVVLSLHMPGLDCLDVCRRIKSNRLKGRIGIIATTVQPSPEAKRAAKDAGAFAYLPKPIDLDLLYKKVQKLLPAWE
jgi:CheY-like chemotaxis protein